MHALHPLLAAFVPIWALTAGGYLVARAGLLGAQAEAVLGRFVFHVAMPAALFTMIARTPLDTFVNASMLAFAAGTAVASLLGFALARWCFGRDLADQAIGGMAAGYVNSANLGIPVAVQVLGDASFIAPVLIFQVLVVTPLILALLDAGTGKRTGGGGADGRSRSGGTARRMLLLPLRNPIVLASALGSLVSATGWHLPATLGHSCELLGNAGVPTALITLGISLHARRPVTGPAQRAEVGAAVVIKTLIQPLVALAVGSLVLHLPAHQLLAVVVCSALPTAQNVFIYAREYGLSTTLARDSVMFSTLVSMGTLSLAGWVLGRQ
ncbi:AEC family transporter [Kitasatospora sp. GP82]|uniref:AEC family transporter n=1 Tax=Kitasatospora sp. GP82 TaxID=3035089 RepID=UPI002475CD8B|nr:AEC family transporter [Kitasatospora sp. GP82]MDH6128871.1 putative permease [Kitasatospora sp. GP82]